jgi:UbiD family decarboxylase
VAEIGPILAFVSHFCRRKIQNAYFSDRLLEQEKEIIRVKTEVDIKYEMGAVCRHVLNAGGVEKNKALFFEKPKGYSIPVAAGLLDSRNRYYLATGTTRENFWREFLKMTENPIPPRIVKDGPCRENILVGKDVDLFKFPIPTWNEKDGGPYITLGAAIMKDPETGIRNVGLYRLMVHDGQNIGILSAQYRQPYLLALKAAKRGEALPVAITIGQDPSVLTSAIAALPVGTDELGLAGAMRGEPVDLVRCETIPLEVPATSEIILEGELRLDDMREEGPFGEFTGYYGERMPRPVISIKAITHRDNPIYEGCYQGRPAIMTHWGMTHVGKWSIVVDKDIDIFDPFQVMWAMGTRVQPHRDIIITSDRDPGTNLDPSIPPEIRPYPITRSSRIGIDATVEFKGFDYPPLINYSPELMKKIEGRWEEYGIK